MIYACTPRHLYGDCKHQILQVHRVSRHQSRYFVQPIECVGAIAWEAKKPLDVTTVIVDPPQVGEVRIKARHSLLCTQIHGCETSALLYLQLEPCLSPQMEKGNIFCSLQIVATALCHTDSYTLDGHGESSAH